MALNDRQQRFCEEYVVDLNATQAAIRAGYSEKTAYSKGSALLKKVEVQARVAELKTDKSAETKLTAAYVISGLMDNYNRAMQAEPVLDREGNPTGEYRYEGNVANKALELLGKHLKLFTDKVEHEGTMPIRIIYEDA